MKNITKLALISSVSSIIFVGCGESVGRRSSLTDEASINTALKTTNRAILDAINNARAEARDCNDGRGIVGPSVALTWNNELYASAYEHSNDLATSDTFSHDGSGTASDVTGSNNGNVSHFNDRIRANGYTDYTLIGENIAGGLESIDLAVDAWLKSPAHCTNIMESEFKEIGVAVVANPDSIYKIYWTQNFGGK
ncbi:MAG: hypothetical protein DSZ07_08190 [Sulfurovum sp.]|nr:MAG: hypothetical protein DSZ07_08190 [Sulfurovum sp.]